MTLTDRINAWAAAIERMNARNRLKPPPVTGWLTQFLMLTLAIAFLFMDRVDSTIPLLTGVWVIGVMRRIEEERRED